MKLKWKLNITHWKPTQTEFESLVRNLVSAIIQETEVEKIFRYRYEIDRKRTFGGQVMSRTLISNLFKVPCKDINIQRTEKNKPFYVVPDQFKLDYPNFNFNISHHGDWVVMVWHSTCSVGVDLMDYLERKTRIDTQTQAETFFSSFLNHFTESEWSFIRSKDSVHEKLKIFYQNWALKESYLKATGIGIGFGLQRLSFDLSVLPILLKIDGETNLDFVFNLEEIDERHCVALATKGPAVEDSEWYDFKI